MRGKYFVIMIINILCISLPVYSQDIYVVSVGISDYQNISDLRFTEADVDVFNEIMSHHTSEITTLKGKQATHANVINTLRKVFAKAKPNDVVMFFFSGHGYEGGFCCYDMKAQSYIGGISYQEMQILFRNCRAGKKLVFADACFSGGLAKQRTQLQVQAVSNQDVFFFLSSKLDEISLELPNGSNGLFTYFLAKGLCREADANFDQIITAQEVYSYVNSNVAAWAGRVSHNQHPTVWGKFNRNMFILNWKQ